MSRWRFQIFRHIDDSGEPYLAIHEYYTLHDGKEGWTARPVPIEAETVEDLRKALAQIIADLDQHGVRDFNDPGKPAEGARPCPPVNPTD